MVHAQPPIIIPRWMLTAVYALFVVLGLVAAWASVPTLDLTTSAGYTSVWSVILAIGATIACVASLRVKWETTEAWGAVVITALLSVYVVSGFVLAFGQGQIDRAAFAVVLLIITVPPAIRAATLIARMRGKK